MGVVIILVLAKLVRAIRFLLIWRAKKKAQAGVASRSNSVYSRPIISILSLPATATDSPSIVIKDFSRS
jgi:hypothetical protein